MGLEHTLNRGFRQCKGRILERTIGVDRREARGKQYGVSLSQRHVQVFRKVE